jgi:phosphatidylglycerol lysyltransferase
VTLCCSAGRLEAFASWRPYRQGHGLYLDLMRKRNDAPFGTMDLLLARSLLHFREQGYEIASLANAPLANTADARATLDRGVAFLFEHFNQIYGYKNLFLFKRKFDPLWEGRYLAYPSLAALPKITYAIVSLHSSGGIFQFLPAAAGALRRQKAA